MFLHFQCIDTPKQWFCEQNQTRAQLDEATANHKRKIISMLKMGAKENMNGKIKLKIKHFFAIQTIFPLQADRLTVDSTIYVIFNAQAYILRRHNNTNNNSNQYCNK